MAPPGALPSSPGAYIAVDVAADNAQHPAWGEPVRIVFERTATGWKLVGLERMPEHIGGPDPAAGPKGTR